MREEFKATYNRQTRQWERPKYKRTGEPGPAQQAFRDKTNAAWSSGPAPKGLQLAPMRLIGGEQVWSITTCARWAPGEDHSVDADVGS